MPAQYQYSTSTMLAQCQYDSSTPPVQPLFIMNASTRECEQDCDKDMDIDESGRADMVAEMEPT